MGRKAIPLQTRLEQAIVSYGDYWLKREGDTIRCLVCKHYVNYTENNIRTRVREHVNTRKHSDLVAKARKGNFCQTESSGDELEHQTPNLPNVKTYIARPDAEIAAALELVAQNVEKTSREEEMSKDGQPVDGSVVDGSSTTPRRDRRDKCWNYMRFTGKQNPMGHDIHECIFCNFELRAHVSTLKSHLCRRCPGIPKDIRDSIKEEGKRTGKRFVKKKSQMGFGYMGLDDSDLEDVGCELDDGLRAEDKAVEILTQLLGQRDTQINDEDDEEELTTARESKVVSSTSKRKLGNQKLDADLDRELKELEIKKVKAELRLLNEKMASEELVKKESKIRIEETKVRIEEGKERTKFFTNINQQFPNFVRIINALSNFGDSGPSGLISDGSNGNILQEAFSEINGSS